MNQPISQGTAAPAAESFFHHEPNRQGFESLAQEDGFKFWWASDMARLMGYENFGAFRKAINKAMIACDALGVPLVENFVQERRAVDGREQLDFRLSRFACYLAAMNGNVNNPLVAQAQAYFVTFAEACRQYLAPLTPLAQEVSGCPLTMISLRFQSTSEPWTSPWFPSFYE